MLNEGAMKAQESKCADSMMSKLGISLNDDGSVNVAQAVFEDGSTSTASSAASEANTDEDALAGLEEEAEEGDLEEGMEEDVDEEEASEPEETLEAPARKRRRSTVSGEVAQLTEAVSALIRQNQALAAQLSGKPINEKAAVEDAGAEALDAMVDSVLTDEAFEQSAADPTAARDLQKRLLKQSFVLAKQEAKRELRQEMAEEAAKGQGAVAAYGEFLEGDELGKVIKVHADKGDHRLHNMMLGFINQVEQAHPTWTPKHIIIAAKKQFVTARNNFKAASEALDSNNGGKRGTPAIRPGIPGGRSPQRASQSTVPSSISGTFAKLGLTKRDLTL